jgi:transposase
MSSAVFKPYAQGQPKLLPPSLEELIPAAHPARVVNAVVDSLGPSALSGLCAGGGASSCRPAMLPRATVYGYPRSVLSSRRLEEAIQESVRLMWLAGDRRPDRDTLARFRSQRLKAGLRPVFAQVAPPLAEKGLVSLEEAYLYGTRIEADAGRRAFVWGKAAKTSRERLIQRLSELADHAERLAGHELGLEPAEFEEAARTARETSRTLKERKAPERERAKARARAGTCQARLERLDERARILGGRDGCSRTDPDAAFMRVKEDRLGDGQLKAAYNARTSTQGQCVLRYSVHGTPGDARTPAPRLEGVRRESGSGGRTSGDGGRTSGDGGRTSRDGGRTSGDGGRTSGSGGRTSGSGGRTSGSGGRTSGDGGRTSGDGGRASGSGGRSSARSGRASARSGRRARGADGVRAERTIIRTGARGRPEGPARSRRRPKAWTGEARFGAPCRGAMRAAPRPPEGPRPAGVRGRARERLRTERGAALRKRRGAEPESVSGSVEHDHGFRRLRPRGMAGAEVETGLVFLAHNLRKLAAQRGRLAA